MNTFSCVFIAIRIYFQKKFFLCIVIIREGEDYMWIFLRWGLYSPGMCLFKCIYNGKL